MIRQVVQWLEPLRVARCRLCGTVAVALLLLAPSACREASSEGKPRAKPTSGYFVSPSDTTNGNGSEKRPWSLARALGAPSVVKPGDTIWLRGGTYQGAFTSLLAGNANRRVVVRQYPGERVTIDGPLTVRGANAEYWDFEVTNSNPVRETTTPGSDPGDYKRRAGIDVHGTGTRFINLVVHDAGGGFGLWTPAETAEIYGCLVYNNGWQGPERGHGHGIYGQGRTGIKTISENIIFHQFGNGINIYGSDQAFLTGFTLEGNVSFNNGLLSIDKFAADIFIGGATPASGIIVRNTYTYREDGMLSVRFGYTSEIVNFDLTLVDNYFVGETSVRNWATATVKGNTFTGTPHVIGVDVPPTATLRDYDWENNRYIPDPRRRVINSDMLLLSVERDSGTGYTFEDWVKRTGHDRRGSTAAKPHGVETFVRPNKYERGRANVVVYNWDYADATTIDVSKVLQRGDRYELRSVQDFYGTPVVRGTYEGKPLTVPLGKLPGAVTVGRTATPPPDMGPEFAAFVLVRANR